MKNVSLIAAFIGLALLSGCTGAIDDSADSSVLTAE